MIDRIFVVLFLAIPTLSLSQVNAKDTTIRIVSISAHWGGQMPALDLAKRFGVGGVAGAGFGIKTKRNYILRGEYSFFYGNKVKEDTILNGIATRAGYILDINASPAAINLLERGFNVGVSFGKVFPVFGSNPNSGIQALFGVGLMQHKIKIQNQFSKIPQLSDTYKKGYDRLSNGLSFSQTIGYQFIGNYSLVNYFFGFELVEGITQNRRTVNYDTGKHDGSTRIDCYGSLVLRWYIPLYKKKPKDFYFY